MLNTTAMQGKPFFMLGQQTPIAYDSLLGINLVLNCAPTSVYLSNYYRDYSTIRMILSTDSDILATIERKLSPGIQTIYLDASDILLSGNITTINTPEVESSDALIEISPMFIHYADTINTDNRTILTVNNKAITGTKVSMIFSEDSADVDIVTDKDGNIVANVTFNKYSSPTIVHPVKTYIQVVDGQPIINGTGTIILPEDFKLTQVNDSFALIQPYTYETCSTSKYSKISEANLISNVAHSTEYPLPLDVCFKKNQNTDGTDNNEDPWILDPYIIDTLIAPDGVSYLQLNSLHDLTDNPEEPEENE